MDLDSPVFTAKCNFFQSADANDEDACPFPTPTFNFVFPIVKSAVKSNLKDKESGVVEKVSSVTLSISAC